MAEWTYSISITNNTDRNLKLISWQIPWGKARNPFPTSIKPNETGNVVVYSPAGVSYGLEFFAIYQDEAPIGQRIYGSINLHIDMPYWKWDRISALTVTGMLKTDPLGQIPGGSHDFSTSLNVYTLTDEEIDDAGC